MTVKDVKFKYFSKFALIVGIKRKMKFVICMKVKLGFCDFFTIVSIIRNSFISEVNTRIACLNRFSVIPVPTKLYEHSNYGLNQLYNYIKIISIYTFCKLKI